MNKCDLCQIALDPNDYFMCKCERLFFCSNKCYRAVIRDHKMSCSGKVPMILDAFNSFCILQSIYKKRQLGKPPHPTV